MRPILEGLGRWRLPDAVRSVAVELDEQADEYVVTMKLRKPSGHVAAGTWRVAARDAPTLDPYAVANRLIATGAAAWNAPEPRPSPEPEADATP